VFKVKK
jgi:hypothetical protein